MSDFTESLQSSLNGRYQLEAEIGSGRLARVFRAQDLRHPRQVAVKALRPDLAGGILADRFLREIEIAAGLTHPNIVPVFDSGERAGIPFFVMPFENGGSLRGRMDREGQFPLADAFRLTHDILEALCCAHSHGVIHLDVKPENVLLSSDHALLADFGIARIHVRETAVPPKGPEYAAGTPMYMSPEQIDPDGKPGPRSDLYSLGCVLYEMLTGERPFKASTPQALMAKHLAETPLSPSLARPALTAEVEALVERALQKQAADRFPDAQAFLRALRAAAVHDSTASEPHWPPAASPARDPFSRASVEKSPGSISVWIVEDHQVYREDVQGVIDGEEDLVCSLAVGSAEEMVDALQERWAPDVVLMDINLPGSMNGIEATAHLKRSSPGTEVIMLTIHEDLDTIFEAFEAGAISYLAKTETDDEIVRAIRAAPKGGSVMTPHVARRFLRMFKQVQRVSEAYQLSPEESDLLTDLASGKTAEQIAEERSLGQTSFDSRMRLIHAKLHANSGAHLAGKS
jgi:serine/threonine protein kinase